MYIVEKKRQWSYGLRCQAHPARGQRRFFEIPFQIRTAGFSRDVVKPVISITSLLNGVCCRISIFARKGDILLK